MKRLSKDEIASVLVEHEKWLADKQTGRQAIFEDCKFEDEIVFPKYCEFGNGCKFGNGCEFGGKKFITGRNYNNLYEYVVGAFLFADGSRWVRMGCLFKSLEEWEKIGIRNSNMLEFPNDGSDKCEERVAAFEFAKASALRMAAQPGLY